MQESRLKGGKRTNKVIEKEVQEDVKRGARKLDKKRMCKSLEEEVEESIKWQGAGKNCKMGRLEKRE